MSFAPWLVAECHDDITGKLHLPWRGGYEYAVHKLRVCQDVPDMGSPNFSGAIIQLPSNLHFKEWEGLIDSSTDVLMLDYLNFAFPTGYKGPVPMPATSNHPFAF